MIMVHRFSCRNLIRSVAALALASGCVSAQAQPAETFPSRAVKIIVGFPVGSSPDIVARAVGDDLSKSWGHPVIIDNRAGAGAIIATDAVAKAAPDGYTIYLATLGALALNPHLYKQLPYDPVHDFAGVTFVAENPFALAVHPSVKANSVAELVALAKANPGKLNYASGASFAQLLGEAFKHRTGVDIVNVPYKGIQPAITEFLAGRVEITFADLPSILPQHKSGKARILGVTGAHRSGLAPEIPTIAEQGVSGYDFSTWYAFVAPAATPRAVIEKLNADIVRSLNKPEIKARLLRLGLDVRPSKPEYVDELIKTEVDKWGRIVKEAKIEPQ